MKKHIISIVLLTLFLFGFTLFSDSSAVNKAQKPKWEKLFNGKNFNGWKSIATNKLPEYGWKIENGALIVNDSGGGESKNGGDIITEKKYANFELKWEWKMMTKGGNSGVKYLVNTISKNNKKHGIGMEYQLLDDAFHPWMLRGKMKPGDYYTLGACYNLYPSGVDKKVKPLGKWNTSRVVCINGIVEHWLNGHKIISFDRFSTDFDQRVAKSKFKNIDSFGKHQSGHILIQDHGSNVHFRKIMIKEYPTE